MIFAKKKRWSWVMVKALLIAQMFYLFARFFLKAAIKQSMEGQANFIKKKN